MSSDSSNDDISVCVSVYTVPVSLMCPSASNSILGEEREREEREREEEGEGVSS